MSPDETSRAFAGPGAKNAGAGAAGVGKIKAYQSVTAWLLLLVPAVAGIGADQWVKAWAFPDGVPGDPELMAYAGRMPGKIQPILDHFLGFTTTVNRGAVFGFAQGHVSVFLAFSVVALAVILWVFATSGARSYVVHVALGLITAGAIGNLYDRAVYHGVRDMLKFLCFHFSQAHLFGITFPKGPLAPDGTVDWYPFIFNVADVLLCVGVPLLMLCWIAEGFMQAKAARRDVAENKSA